MSSFLVVAKIVKLDRSENSKKDSQHFSFLLLGGGLLVL